MTVWIRALPGPKSGTWGTQSVGICIPESHGHGTIARRKGGNQCAIDAPAMAHNHED
jgi:hypothetical protein